MADLAAGDTAWCDLDDIGYGWRREQLLEDGADAEIAAARDVQRLESERLRPSPRDPDPLAESFRSLIGLIAGECRRAGYPPP